jgi:hypothetical protein
MRNSTRSLFVCLFVLTAAAALGQGIITTMAGSPFASCGPLGDGGPATSAQLCNAFGPVVDSSGNIFFYDYGNHRIRQVAPNGIITTVAGNGANGTAGDGGPALSASLGSIHQLAWSNVAVSWGGVAVPTMGQLCFGDGTAYKVRCVSLDSGIIQGYGTGLIAFGGQGDGGPFSGATFNSPAGVVFDGSGNLYISDFGDNRVRKVDALLGTITTFAGPGPGYCCSPVGDGGPATSANLYEPEGLAYSTGALYIADQGNVRVRRVDLSSNIITTVAGNGTYSAPADGTLATSGGVSTSWLATDSSGNLFLGGVREVNAAGIIATIAGLQNQSGYGSDDIPATQTAFGGLNGLAWDPVAQRLLIVDQSRIRQIFFTPATTTALTSSQNPILPSTTITLQASVSPSDATGSVRFYTGFNGSGYATSLGSQPVVNGVATLSWTAPVFTGNTVFTAVYGGDSTHNLSQSPSLTETVQQAPTTTTLTSSMNPSSPGQSVTFTATVTPAAATGTVTFNNGFNTMGSGTLQNGVATFTTTTLPAGSNSIQAVYSGNGSYTRSTSPVLIQSGGTLTSTTTSVTATPNPAAVGAAVTLAATVTPSTATGTVQFLDGATVVGTATLANGSASFITSALTQGTHSITAVYSGDASDPGSTSSAVSEIVQLGSTVTLASSLNPSVVGQTVTFTANVTASATGTVQFLDGSTVLSTVPLSSGAAVYSTSGLNQGIRFITTVYSGDATYLTSRSLALVETVNNGVPGQAVITTLAGTPFGSCAYSGDGGPSMQAAVCNPQVPVTDGAGNIYFSDAANSVIRKITPAGIISTIAGNHTRGTAGDGGPATSANLGIVRQLAYDGANNLCFGDQQAYKIRCVSLTTGIIQGYGTGISTSAGDGGPFASASFHMPQGVAFVPRSQGNPDLFIADSTDNIIRKVDGTTGIITRVAGTGLSGPLGDGGPATSAMLQAPQFLTYYNGSLYFADQGNDRIRQLNLSTGIINTVAGNGTPYFAGDGGPATAAQLTPYSVTFDPIGDMYLTDAGSRIRVVNTSGIITTYAGASYTGLGPDNVPPGATYFSGFGGIYWNAAANQLLIADGVNKLRQVTYQASATSVTATPNPAAPGSQVTITATVSPAAATGTVYFYVNSSLLGSAPLSGGQAAYTWTASGSNASILAAYSGDPVYAPSPSSSVTVTIQRLATTTAITATPNPSNLGQAVTLTATVTSATATGTVQFYGSGSLLGTGTLTNGVATLSTSFAAAGPVTLYATYSGDNNNAPSTSANLAQTVNATATTTTAASTLNPSLSGAAVTFNATVNPSTATGTVQFLDGTTVLGTATLAGGAASFSTSTLAAGAHAITAVYGGDANNAGSTSAIVTQTVKASTTTSLVSSSNPITLGGSATFTATVAPAAATGTVQFTVYNSGNLMSTVSVPVSGGLAIWNATNLTSGSNTVTASYSGDANYGSSTSAALSETVRYVSYVILTSSPNPSILGGAVALTATLSPPNNGQTGSVEFFNGATSLGTAPVNASGIAQLTAATLPAGTNALTATYSGDTNFAPSTSASIQQTVNKPATTTGLSSSSNPSIVGGNVSFSVTVTPSTATGTIQFLDGAAVLSTVTLSGGTASFSSATLAQGTHSITAVYSGDAANAGSTSAIVSQVVNAKTVTSTTVTSSANPSIVGTNVTLNATVTPSTATGTVQFLDGAAVLATVTLTNGAASYSTSTLVLGAHSITVVYSGDANNAGSTSAVFSQTVNLTATTTTLTSTVNPSAVGNPVMFAATVSSGTGSVQFFDGATSLGTANIVSGTAQLVVNTLTRGTHSITAVYGGDANNASSTSTVYTQTVKLNPNLSLSSNPDPSVTGQTVTITARVVAAATGTIQFMDGSTVLGTATLSGGSAAFSTSSLALGAHTLTVNYSGDSNYLGEPSSGITQTVNAKTATVTTLTSNANPAFVGASVTLTATVNPGAATGTVQFLDGATVLGSSALASGAASFTSSTFAAGTHSITAVYSGDTANAGSTSAALIQTVNAKAVTATTLTSSLNPSTYGASVTFRAAVTPATATGSVQFLDGTTVLATSTVIAGSASLTSQALAVGTHPITAVYSGDVGDTGSTSSALSQVVNKVTSSTTIASSLNPSAYGQAVQFTATVTPSTATGTVTFSGIGSATLSGGVASITTSSLAVGTTTVTAQFNGDANDNASTSAGLAQVVKTATTTSLTSSPNASSYGHTVTLTATVTPSSATGSVQFYDGTTMLGTGTLNGGRATYSANALAVGSHSLTAVYLGGNDAGSTSAVDVQTVNKVNTSTKLTESASSGSAGQSVTFTATITPGTATGTVQFLSGGTVLATVPVSSGVAVFSTSSLPSGTNYIQAAYSGDANAKSSNSSTVTYRVR